MKKILCVLLSFLITAAMLQGCSFNKKTSENAQSSETAASDSAAEESAGSEESSAPEQTEMTPAAEESSESSTPAEGEASEESTPELEVSSEESLPETEESSEEGAPATEEPENSSDERFVFQPKVCSAYIREIFGDTMCETWFNFVDAVMAGEDTFACPDNETYDWVIGQFPDRCFPVLVNLIEPAYDRNHPVKDGVASFTWVVPPEEAAVQIEEFSAQIEKILNQAMKPDYSDFEKVLALYDYFCRTYVYDYDIYRQMYEEAVDLRTIDFFRNGTGVCQQISNAYSYLLMQTGTDATIMMGGDHQWSYIRINGHNYHVDPTFAMGQNASLAYFMMSDEQREATVASRVNWTIASVYTQDHPHPDYIADDDTYQPLWNKYIESLDIEENIIHCGYDDENGEWATVDLDYSDFDPQR